MTIPLSILIVEDEAIIAIMLECQLTDLGFKKVMMASSGEKALEVQEREKPDVVLMDINLATRMTGIETAKRMKQNDPGVLIAFMSAYGTPDLKSQISPIQPIAFLEKPVSTATLEQLCTQIESTKLS